MTSAAFIVAAAWLTIPAAAVLTIDAVSRLRGGQSREVRIDLPPKPLPAVVMETDCDHPGCHAAADVLRSRLVDAFAADLVGGIDGEWARMNGAGA